VPRGENLDEREVGGQVRMTMLKDALAAVEVMERKLTKFPYT
jgi:hypothetical protein